MRDLTLTNRMKKKPGETPLLFMAWRIRTRIPYRRERAVRYLLKKGANMIYQSRRDQNPLADAAVRGDTGVVRIMLEHFDAIDTPLEIGRPFVLYRLL